MNTRASQGTPFIPAPRITTVAGYLLTRLAEAGLASVFGVPGVAVGGVAGALFGGHADPGQVRPVGEGVEDGQVVVARHAEDRGQAGFG